MTGDLVEAMRACPQPIVAAVEGVCAGAGAIMAMASDLRLAAPQCEDRLPVHPRRPVGRGHGRLRDPAADHRPRPRRRTAVHRPQHERRGRRRLGLLEPPHATMCWPKRRRLRASWRSGPTFAHAVTKRQLDAEWHVSIDEAIDMEAEAQADVHGDQRLPPRLRGLRGQAHSRSSRATDLAYRSFLAWPFFEPTPLATLRAHAASSNGAPRPSLARRGTRDDRRRANAGRSVQRRLARARASSSCVASTATSVPTCAASRSPAKRSPIIRGLADFAFAMQGLGSGAISLVRNDRAEARMAAARSRAARPSPPSP